MTAPRPNDTTLDQHIDLAVERIGDRFHGHDTVLRDMLRAPMHQAYQQGRHDAIFELQTIPQVATELGVTRQYLHELVTDRDLGWRVGRDVLLRPEEVATLRGIVGQPKGS